MHICIYHYASKCKTFHSFNKVYQNHIPAITTYINGVQEKVEKSMSHVSIIMEFTVDSPE
jgi:hypothetical protein